MRPRNSSSSTGSLAGTENIAERILYFICLALLPSLNIGRFFHWTVQAPLLIILLNFATLVPFRVGSLSHSNRFGLWRAYQALAAPLSRITSSFARARVCPEKTQCKAGSHVEPP